MLQPLQVGCAPPVVEDVPTFQWMTFHIFIILIDHEAITYAYNGTVNLLCLFTASDHMLQIELNNMVTERTVFVQILRINIILVCQYRRAI